jgi:hypothetical protein
MVASFHFVPQLLCCFTFEFIKPFRAMLSHAEEIVNNAGHVAQNVMQESQRFEKGPILGMNTSKSYSLHPMGSATNLVLRASPTPTGFGHCICQI